jgi:uncharacterized membrane protein
MQAMTEPRETPLLFEAVIVPHRCLSPRALRVLLGAIAVLSGLIALRFLLIGAWPVLAFSLLEVGAVMLLLWHNARAARGSELVLLSGDALRIIRTDQRGRRTESTLQPAWLRVVLEERPGRTPRLWLAGGRTQQEIGACLGEEEKRDLARALSGALFRLQNPVFDNAQLR